MLYAVVGLHLVYLVDGEGAHGDDDEHAEPAVVEEVGASHAGEDADDDDEQHVYLVFHKIFFHSDFPPRFLCMCIVIIIISLLKRNFYANFVGNNHEAAVSNLFAESFMFSKPCFYCSSHSFAKIPIRVEIITITYLMTTEC